jgi:outer membrane protein assembly factor BamB
MVGLMVLAWVGLLACTASAPEPEADAAPIVSAEAAALHAAARDGNLAEVRRWIEEEKVPVDVGDRYDATALMMASDRGHVEVVQYLIDAGADVNHREVFFNTSAFDLAVWRQKIDVGRVLLAAGSDQREDALGLAVEYDAPDLARAAIEAGPLNESAVEELRARADLTDAIRALLEDAQTRPDPAPPVYTREQLERFEGHFESWDATSGKETRVSVGATDDGLSVAIDDQAPTEFVASGEREFRSGDGELEISFWGRLGTVESVTLYREGQPPLSMRHSIAQPLGAEAYDYDGAGEAAAAAGENWPQFRGPNASGVGDGDGLAAVWDVEAGTGIRWQVELPGLGNASPIVWGDLIIVTTAVAEGIEQEVRTGLTGAGDPVDEAVDHSWRVMAFDKHSGEELWNTEVGRGVPVTRRHFKATQANSTPATDGEHLVVVFPTAGMAGLGLDGTIRWKHDLGGLNVSSPNDPGVEWGFASSPVVYEGMVIVQIDTYVDPYLAAWDLKTGEQVWKTERDVPPSWATPTVIRGDAGDELVVNAATIHGYDPATGESLWSLAPNSELVIATPVVGDGVVYVSAGYAPVKPIYAIRYGTRGEFDVEPGTPHARLAWSHSRGGAYIPTPLLYRGILYVVHHNGRMVAYDADSGAAIYKTRFSRGGTFTASPVAAGGQLYISTEEGLVYVVEAGPEFKELAVNDMGGPVMATPALSRGTIFVRTPDRLFAIGS